MNTRSQKMHFGAIMLILIVSIQSMLGVAPGGRTTPSYDTRRDVLPQLQLTAERQQAAAELEARQPGVRIDYDAVTGTPHWISRMGFLSRTTAEEIQRSGDLGLQRDDPHRAIKAFLIENAVLFEHGAEVLTNAAISREFVTAHNGLRTVEWRQQLDGIPVFEAALKGHVTQAGRLVNLSSRLLPDVANASGMDQAQRLQLETAPPISATQAVAIAVTNLGEQISLEGLTATGDPEGPTRKQKFTAAPLLGEARAELVWLPINRSSLKLCWVVRLLSRSSLEVFRTLVDARSGEVPVRQNVTCRTDASYLIFPSDSPSPFTPGHPTPSSVQPEPVDRQLVTLDSLSATASPEGWVHEGSNPETLGNNVDARAWPNWDNLPIVDPLPRPQATLRVFDFDLNLNEDPATYRDAAVVNLFYWANWMHDKLYDLGFTEAAGNFQFNNFGRGGSGGDEMLVYAQAGADNGWANNAFYVPASDGDNGEIYMHIWDSPDPRRDGDLDAELILHEYTHGLSSRLAGDNGFITALQSQGLGEGWSDFYALSLLSQTADNVNGNYPIMGYVIHQRLGLTENYYYGIRRYPYTHDMTRNPLTFKDIDPSQADNCSSGADYNPWLASRYGSCAATPANEAHSIGEVWCVTLWEARRNLIARYGGPVGNQIMLQLVTDGMNLCPPNPNFIQARDAFFDAVEVSNHCEDNWADLWAAFSKRGLGSGASAPDSAFTSPVVESFAGGPPSPCQTE